MKDYRVESLIPGTDAYDHMCQSNIKSYAIAGNWEQNAKASYHRVEGFFKDVTGNASFSLEKDGFNGNQNDLLVSLKSQLGGLMHNQTQSLKTDFIPYNSKV